MCANLWGSILFSVTSTQRCSVSSSARSSPFISLKLLSFQKKRNPFKSSSSLICSSYPSSIYPSIHPSFHPFLHPTLAWLRVVSCREAVNNLSALVVLPCTAPLFWMKNILRGTRNPHRLWQRIWSIACTALLINTCSVCQIINSCILLLTLNATGIQKDA